ncbi:MAG: aspartate 1-decarboxylase [Opitutales bacterium]|jgi:aspartate 1-decarboxylase|nr:aspartate 1-decarboxylase [Opitutales bacterium]
MQISLLKSKLHQASVTSARPDYSGSLSIDQNLMEAAGILHHEKILVGNITNGERFETYCIPADHGSGEIGLNGAAAHKGKAGDLLVIMTFINLNPEEAAVWEPRLVLVSNSNLNHELIKSPQ